MNRFIINYEADGIANIIYGIWGKQLWIRTNTKVRKNHNCQRCKKEIIRGKEKAYRPLSNLGNRYHRFCLKCVEQKSEGATLDELIKWVKGDIININYELKKYKKNEIIVKMLKKEKRIKTEILKRLGEL